MKDLSEENKKKLALGLTVLCVRNTNIEDIHSGTVPFSQTGDYSDVRVTTPKGDIPWNDISRISNDEMQSIMRQVADRLYTSLLRMDDADFVDSVTKYADRAAIGWAAPQNLINWFTGKWEKFQKASQG